jgi:hypothetical protein
VKPCKRQERITAKTRRGKTGDCLGRFLKNRLKIFPETPLQREERFLRGQGVSPSGRHIGRNPHQYDGTQGKNPFTTTVHRRHSP